MHASERGERTRREVLGDAHVDRAAAGVTPLNADFQDFITRYAWGEVWSRPGLDRRTRRLVTIAVLAALGRDGELDMHLRAALREDLTPQDVAELMLHVSLYSGLPVGNHGLAATSRILAETDDYAEPDRTGDDAGGDTS